MFSTSGGSVSINNDTWYPDTTTSAPVWTTGLYSTTIWSSPAPEAIVVKKAKQFIVIQRNSGTVAAVEDSEAEAISAARRLAAKNEEEYFVFKPAKSVRPVPVDVEVVDS